MAGNRLSVKSFTVGVRNMSFGSFGWHDFGSSWCNDIISEAEPASQLGLSLLDPKYMEQIKKNQVLGKGKVPGTYYINCLFEFWATSTWLLAAIWLISTFLKKKNREKHKADFAFFKPKNRRLIISLSEENSTCYCVKINHAYMYRKK